MLTQAFIDGVVNTDPNVHIMQGQLLEYHRPPWFELAVTTEFPILHEDPNVRSRANSYRSTLNDTKTFITPGIGTKQADWNFSVTWRQILFGKSDLRLFKFSIFGTDLGIS